VKALRIVLIVGVLLGVAVLYFDEKAQPFGAVPFPGPGQYVQLPLRVLFRSTYKVEAAIPTLGNPLTLDKEPPIRCDLTVTIKDDRNVVSTQRVTSITRGARFGYGHTDLYRVGKGVEILPGEYTVVFEGSGQCEQAAARGGTVELVEDVGDPTSHYLLMQARHGLALLLGFGGSVSLVFLEIWRRPNMRWSGP
jgi:hypothetical protein